MNEILNIVSGTASFLFGTGMIHILLDGTIGRLKVLHSRSSRLGLQVKDLVFLSAGAFVILNYTSFVLPY